jgi:hypothetical protein
VPRGARVNPKQQSVTRRTAGSPATNHGRQLSSDRVCNSLLQSQIRFEFVSASSRVGGEDRPVVAQAPRIDERLVGALSRLDRNGQPVAEIHRNLGLVADALGMKRPSYQQTRVILQSLRAQQRSPRIGETLLDIALRNRPPVAIIELLAP